MKSIRLDRLDLRDFKGMTFRLDAHGADVNVFGRNATGKTTLDDAYSWLITGKDSLGRSDFEIKTLDAQGEAAHGLEHSVEARLSIDVNEPPLDKLPEGARTETVTLKKVYSEIWSKKRGSPMATFTGHTTKHYINDVPVSEKDYAARVAEIAGDEQVFRLLTSPTAFPALHWEKQRTLLLAVCGDTTDADVIATDEKLAPLTEILKKYKSSKTPFNDHKKVIAARRVEINKEMEKIPVRIDEQRRSLPDTTGLVRTAIDSDIALLSKEIADLSLQRSGVDTGSGIAELSKRLAGISADLQKMESAHYTETMKAYQRMTQQVMEVTNRITDSKRRISAINGDIEAKNKRLSGFDSVLDGLRSQWSAINAEVFQDTTVDSCAACGQALPADRVQAARDKALAAFNTSKADRLADNEKRGYQHKEDKDRLVAEIDALTKERDILMASQPESEERLQKLTAERDAVKALAEDYTVIAGRQELTLEASSIQLQIETARAGVSTDSVMIKNALDVAQSKLTANKEFADRFVRREAGEKRIEELKASEKVLAAEFERLEAELYLCEQFIRTKVSLLTTKINDKFEIVNFKLFNELVNGGLEEVCEITIKGVSYGSGLNSAARTNAGLDIMRTLQRHYGIQAPVFCDNAESVIDLLPVECQMIRLIVSANDPILKVELAAKKELQIA